MQTRPLAIPGVEESAWSAVVNCPHAAKGNRMLGIVERVLYFACIVMGAQTALAGLLAFKVASKWAVWQHIEKVPETFSEDASHFENWKARDALATRYLQEFMIGTFGNLLVALTGYVTAPVVVSLYWWMIY